MLRRVTDARAFASASRALASATGVGARRGAGSSAEAPVQEFHHAPLFATTTAKTDVEWRLVTREGVREVQSAGGETFLEVRASALRALAARATRDVSHLLRPGHLRQLRKILDDAESSKNDRFVALELLKNACVAAGMVLPGCQDTVTAIVMGKRGGRVLTDGDDEEALSRGVYDTYTTTNLRYSQVAPLTMFEEKNTGTNLPAQIDLYATSGD